MSFDEAQSVESRCFSIVLEDDGSEECPANDIQSFGGQVKVPVILGEFTVQFDIEAKIKLPEPALEIKRIKKNVFLTQCRLIPRTNKVFLGGFVRKNIEYATIDCITEKAICGAIKNCTVHVPFLCTAQIKCLRPAHISSDSPSKQITYFDEENLGICLKEQDFISTESFNERVYCELDKSSIYEADIIEDGRTIPFHPRELEFQTIIEKVVVELTLKLLQKQQTGNPFIDQEC